MGYIRIKIVNNVNADEEFPDYEFTDSNNNLLGWCYYRHTRKYWRFFSMKESDEEDIDFKSVEICLLRIQSDLTKQKRDGLYKNTDSG